MAALAQPDLLETSIREVLASVPLPEGLKLRRLEFRNDSTGDPALFLIFSRSELPESDEEQAQNLLALKKDIRRQLRDFGLSLFPYFVFVPAE
jgi:hypothetical protein